MKPKQQLPCTQSLILGGYWIDAFFRVTQEVKVVGIADGDTFMALFIDKQTERIRLYGIDVEMGRAYGRVIKKYSSND